MKAILGTVPMLLWGTLAQAQQGPIPLLPAPMVAASAVPASPAGVTSASPVDSGYLRTTTDSLEYCKHLHGRVGDLLRGGKGGDPDATDQVRSLSEEGERLCENGQMRSGILHLRRAFVLLNKAEPAR